MQLLETLVTDLCDPHHVLYEYKILKFSGLSTPLLPLDQTEYRREFWNVVVDLRVCAKMKIDRR